jgi:hypothetical protein
VVVNVLANDYVPPATALPVTVRSVTSPVYGTAVVTADKKTVVYTPPAAPMTTLTDTFEYVIQDGVLASSVASTAKVTVTVYSAPPYTWVTPTTTQSCETACNAMGTDWRYVNGGSDTWALCAGLIDLPNSLGQQWITGKFVHSVW